MFDYLHIGLQPMQDHSLAFSLLAGYEHEDHAAEAFDVAALKCKGYESKTNFESGRCALRAWR